MNCEFRAPKNREPEVKSLIGKQVEFILTNWEYAEHRTDSAS